MRVTKAYKPPPPPPSPPPSRPPSRPQAGATAALSSGREGRPLQSETEETAPPMPKPCDRSGRQRLPTSLSVGHIRPPHPRASCASPLSRLGRRDLGCPRLAGRAHSGHQGLGFPMPSWVPAEGP